jgi:hypothetical protein
MSGGASVKKEFSEGYDDHGLGRLGTVDISKNNSGSWTSILPVRGAVSPKSNNPGKGMTLRPAHALELGSTAFPPGNNPPPSTAMLASLLKARVGMGPSIGDVYGGKTMSVLG